MTEKLRAAAQAALDWLENTKTQSMEEYLQVIDGLKDALAEQTVKESLTVAEPVAWLVTYGDLTHVEYTQPTQVVDTHYQPLYPAPPRREWVGLTDDEIEQGNKESWVTEQAWQSAVWWAETKLREKNGG